MKCSAKKTNGEPCKAGAIKGGTVCRTHGGSAPQVRRKANERLQALVDPAITRLAQILKDADSKHPHLMSAIREVLNRDGRIGADAAEREGGLMTLEQIEVILRKTTLRVEGADGTNAVE